MANQLQSDSDAATASGWRLLGTRDFGCLWAGQVVSQIGDGLSKVALLWVLPDGPQRDRDCRRAPRILWLLCLRLSIFDLLL